MNDIQSLIDRQLGIYCRLNYDNVLKRLMVDREESFYGLQSGNVIENFDQDPPIFACRFAETSGYEHFLALANEDGRVAIQDTTNVKTASDLESFQCHNNAVFDLAWRPGHMNFLTVSGDHTACLWDISEGAPKRVLVFSSHTRSVKTAVFRPTESSVFATGARDGHILIWDIRANNQPAVVLKPDNCLTSCHSNFAPKTPSGSHSKRARLDAPRAISITGLVFQDAATLLSCGECDGNIKAWDLRKNYNAYRREPLPKHSIPYCGSSAKNGYTNLILDAARTRLYASCMDDVIYCFNVAAYGALPERRYVGHENGSFYIKTGLSPDGAYLVSGSSDKHAYLWSVRRSEPLARLAGHRAEVTCAAWGPRGDTTLVTCSDDARHMIWRVGPELLAPDAAPQGRAEPAPLAAAAPRPAWGARDRTPSALKRRAGAAPAETAAKRARDTPGTERKTKRCLLALLNGAARDTDEAESAAKRLKPNAASEEPERVAPEEPARAHPGARTRSARLKRPHEDDGAAYWYGPGTSLVSSPEAGEARGSPRRRRSASPAAVRIVSFSTPTKDLPNFVLDGEAPHLRLMSPAKKKREAPDWLTQMVRERRGRGDEAERLGGGAGTVAPQGTKENCPPRRNSVSDKTPKSNKKSRTLLKYFFIAGKEKSGGK